MARIETIVVGPLQTNCSIIADEPTSQAVVVDPGDEAERIARALARMGATAVALLHTHAHFDHISGTAELSGLTGAPIRLHAADYPLYERLEEQAGLFGLSTGPPLPPDSPISDGEVIPFGNSWLRAIHTPGHTPGSTCFKVEGSPVLFSGDTLFPGGPGNTRRNPTQFATIIRSIRQRLFTLPDDTVVLPGHGADTTIGTERPHLQEWIERGW